MNKRELGILAALVTVFVLAYFLNFADARIQNAIMEAFFMLQWYAQYHTLACVVPAMFIAGAIAVFFSKETVLRHLGPKANKIEAYGVASTSGTVLAVCSCSVLPMFAGIYRVGAGIGPASAFLYSGPAINVMAIFLTARVLGYDLGIARVIGSIVFAVIIGLIMAVIFRKEDQDRTAAVMALPDPPPAKRNLWQTALFFVCMIAFLVFSDWANPSQTVIEKSGGTVIVGSVLQKTDELYRVQLNEPLMLERGAELSFPAAEIASEVTEDAPEGANTADGVAAVAALITKTDGTVLHCSVLERAGGFYRVSMLEPLELKNGKKLTFPTAEIASQRDETPDNYRWAAWVFHHRWHFAGACFLAVLVMIWRWFEREELGEWMEQTWSFSKSIIPLLFGGVLITGFVGALIPEQLVAGWVGGDSIRANLIASMIGGLWYFATLTEIPILEALLGLGMGRGPALALLLAGPALSLPSIAVIYSVMGFKKTAMFVALCVIMSTVVGMVFGWFFT